MILFVLKSGRDSGMDYVSIYPKTPTLVQEINAALREWNKIAQDLYVQCNVSSYNIMLIQL